MNEPKNGVEAAPAAATQMPTLGIKETVAHGADPIGSECAIVIRSVTGQEIRLHFGALEALADFSLAVKGALNQMRQNSRGAGSEVTAATPASNFNVGHISGTPGTMLVLDPETPNESCYLFSNQMAVDIGKLLVMEGGKRLRIDEAIAGGKGLTKPPPRRIIRPGEH